MSGIKNNMSSVIGYHLVAFLTVAIWGTTFVFTKILLHNGLSPALIFTLRFILAYVLMVAGSLAMKHFKVFADSWYDEILMVLLGVTGGSLYFLTENASMLYTTATNTSLIVCTCPLFAMLLIAIVYRQTEHISRMQAIGSLIACVGMVVVVLNGRFVLHLSPVGDLLGVLFVADEAGAEALQLVLHHTQGVLLWNSHHYTLLFCESRLSVGGGPAAP